MSTPAMGYPVEAGHAGRTAFSSMAEIANHTFDGFERLARLNLQTMKTTLAEQHGIALEVVDERSFDWLLTLPVAQAQAGLKKTLAYWQRVNAIAFETAANNAGAGWEGFTECTHWWSAALADAGRTRAGRPLVLCSPAANLPVSTGSDSVETPKTGGKRRTVDIVDSSGNVVSSVKQ
ncbi:MAG TPA: phasin family protein [Trinickia sp.]|uniref:phasin family protein n=1 Tax=Trinickia sp. TaxID=2571163 RepID=UPI002B621962|nr:phasin family protein [Trinickia sp.]HVW49862.1 phasin family protein [Trinickia sp.]